MNEAAHATLEVKNRGLVLAVLLLGTFAAVMNMSVTNVALPSIAKALDAEGSAIAWISDAFSIALTSFVLLSGAIGDRYGRRNMYLLGALLAIPGSLASAWSGDTSLLIAARFFTGLADHSPPGDVVLIRRWLRQLADTLYRSDIEIRLSQIWALIMPWAEGES